MAKSPSSGDTWEEPGRLPVSMVRLVARGADVDPPPFSCSSGFGRPPTHVPGTGKSAARRVFWLRPAPSLVSRIKSTMLWQPCQGLRSCVLHHPPMVTFFLCVVTLGFTYLSLGVYIKTQPVRDIDFTQDWGGILQAVSLGKVCPRGNSSRRMTTVEGTRTVNPEDSANVSALVTFTVSPWQLAVNHSSLQIIATGTQLGMRGPGEDTPLTISLTPYWWSIQCNGSEAECTVKYCVSLTGPRDLLPQSTWSPQCPVNSSGVPVAPEMCVLETEPSASTKCYSLVYDGYLNQNVLSEEDADLCAQRLLNVTLVILVLGLLWMVLFAFCTPPSKEKKTDGPL